MPINNQHVDVFVPPDGTRIMKYLDLYKFLSIVQRQQLFFNRLDLFEDKFEGVSPEKNLEVYTKYLYSLKYSGFFSEKVTEEQIERMRESRGRMERDLRNSFCVNCWNSANTEGYALWKIYSENGKGLAIESTVADLSSSLEGAVEDIKLSKVKYIDFKNDSYSPGNVLLPVIHKHLAYKYEEEIRLIHHLVPDKGLKYDWSREENPAGKYINIDVKKLVNRILIGPFMPQWMTEVIVEIVKIYKLDIPIEFSELR